MRKKAALKPNVVFPLSLILLLLLQTSCITYEISCLWREKKLLIDGSSSDWLGTLTYIEEHGISVGLQNDDKNLYVCMILEESSPYMSVMRLGFTLWFDAAGGKNKALGIKLASQRPQRPPARDDPNFVREEFSPEQGEKDQVPRITILAGEDDTGTRLDQENTHGIEARRLIASGLLVYEFKIPLVKSKEHPFAIASSPGCILGIGFESDKIDQERIQAAGGPTRMRGGGGPPGGLGGGSMGERAGMGGRNGMGGGGRGRPDAFSRKNLKIWIKTELAEQLSPSF